MKSLQDFRRAKLWATSPDVAIVIMNERRVRARGLQFGILSAGSPDPAIVIMNERRVRARGLHLISDSNEL